MCECVCARVCVCVYRICIWVCRSRMTHAKLNRTVQSPTFAGQNITTTIHLEQTLHGRNCYNHECVCVCVCVCCKCVQPIKAIKSSANRPPCCILIRQRSTTWRPGPPCQTTLIPVSTSSTNAAQNHCINTLHHLAPPWSTHTDANASLTVWQILPSIQNEWGKNKKKKRKESTAH